MIRSDLTPIHRHRREALILAGVLTLSSVLSLIYVIVWMAPVAKPPEVGRAPGGGSGPIR